MDVKASFELIIPFAYKGQGLLNDNFLKVTFSQTSQLEGKALLDETESPLVGIYELREGKSVGLHKNEGHKYSLVKEKIDFKMGKVRIWLFKSGIGFITVRISAGLMDEELVAELFSKLCNIKEAKSVKISYVQPTGKDTSEIKELTFKKLISNLLALMGAGFTAIDGITYTKAYGVFYGVGSGETEGNIFSFLERLRNQSRSGRGLIEYEKKDFYSPSVYKHIKWGVSERVLAMFGDLEIAKKGETALTIGNNEKYLNSGHIYSVFNNYLLLFLNLLSVDLKLKELKRVYCLDEPDDLLSEEARAEIERLLKYPVTNLSNELHINTLFDSFVYEKALGLNSKRSELSKLNEAGNDSALRRDVAEIKDKVENIDKNVSALLNSVNNMISNQREGFPALKDLKSAEFEEQCSEFIGKVAEEISKIAMKDIASVDCEAQLLKGMFGDSWELLDGYTQKSLISAKVLFANCNKESYKALDFSGIVIAATSALENELKRRFFLGYQQYLTKTVGEPSDESWPKSMLFKRCDGTFVASNRFEMGAFKYLFEFKPSQEMDKLLLDGYLKTVMGDPFKEKGVGFFTLKDRNGKSFIDRCEDVRTKYRNNAAHTSYVTKEAAADCCNIVIGPDAASAKIGEVQGLLYDLVRITEKYGGQR